MKKVLILLSYVFLCAWSNDSNVNTPICDAVGSQNHPQIISDGSGGLFIVWQDYRSGNADIYAQRVDRNGNALWVDDGVIVCSAAKDQLYPKMVSDGAGGAIITWMDCRGTSPDIYAQRISSNGKRLWSSNGVPICTNSYWQEDPHIVPSGSNGAIIAWRDNRRGWTEPYAQRINGNGSVLWTANGVAALQDTISIGSFVTLSDSFDGVIILWYASHISDDHSVPPVFTYTGNTYGQKLDSSGSRRWNENGMILKSGVYVDFLKAVSDNDGGVIIAQHGCDDQGYAKLIDFRVDAQGILQWEDSISDHYLSLRYDVTRDKSGNIYLSLMHYPDTVYIRKLNQNGQLLWMSSILVSIGTSYYNDIAAVPDDITGGIFFARRYGLDYGSDNYLYAHRVDADGNDIWNSSGTLVSSAVGQKSEPLIAPDGSGGAIIVWMDKRTGESDIYGQKVCNEGDLDSPQPPNVTISGRPISGKPPLNVSFVSTVTGDQNKTPFSYLWNFGDGTSSTEENPLHTYTATGQYTVTLTVTDSAIPPRSAASTLVIDVSYFPLIFSDNFNDNNYNGWTPSSSSAWFMFNTGSGGYALNGQTKTSSINLAPATAEFINGNIVEYDFNIRSGQSVVKQISGFVFDYRDANNYSLIMMNGYTPTIQVQRIVNGTPTIIYTGVIPVLDYNIWYHFKAILDSNLLTVEINGVKAIDSYNYGSPTSTRMGLWISGSSVLFDDFIVKRDASLDANTAPDVSISANVLEGSTPLEVTFTSTVTDRENDVPFTYDWNFGDGSTHSADQNPVHTFTTTGLFTVTCSVTDSGSPNMTGADNLTIDVSNYNIIFTDNFDDGDISDWSNLSGTTWSAYRIADDYYRLAGSTNGTGTILSPAVAEFHDGNTVEFDFQFRSGQAQTKKKFGFYFDYQSDSICGMVRLNFEMNTVELYRNGSLLLTANVAPKVFNTWYHFKASMTSGHLTVSIDGTKIIDNFAYGTVTSNTNGLWIWASSMFFDDYTVKEVMP